MSYFHDEEIKEVMLDVVRLYLIPRFNDHNMNATGEWLDNLEITAGDDTGTIRGRQYSEQLAKGREPGKRPPIAPIMKWAQAKLGLSVEDSKGAAYAIATKIAQEGTTWYQKGGTDLLEVLEELATVEYVRERLTGIITPRLVEELRRNAVETLEN